MLSLEDCIAMCGLEEQEIRAIAEHEHMPEIAAAALAGYFLRQPKGETEIRKMIVEDLQAALKDKQLYHATELLMTLRHFLTEHPGAGLGETNCAATVN